MTQAQTQAEWSRAKRWGRTAAVAALTAAVVVPVTAYAADGFNDVPDSNVFHDDINWMRDNGVTAGCNPPANDEYCPDETVTREQMAAFMHRLESEGVFLTTAGKAADADKLDGLDGTHYANPIAIASGSRFAGGTHVTVDGEVARLTLDAPASGDVIARLSSSWGEGGGSYSVAMWIERHRTGDECDDVADGDALPGTTGVFTSHADDLSIVAAGSLSGAGSDAGVSQGTHDYSLCLQTTTGSAENLDWSGSVEWRAAGASTAAMTSEPAESAPTNAEGLLSSD